MRGIDTNTSSIPIRTASATRFADPDPAAKFRIGDSYYKSQDPTELPGRKNQSLATELRREHRKSSPPTHPAMDHAVARSLEVANVLFGQRSHILTSCARL